MKLQNTFEKMKALLVHIVCFCALVQGDVTNITTPLGTCLKVTASGVINARNAPCGSVIGKVNAGEFYQAGGSNRLCDMSGEKYDFHSLNLNGKTAWVAGEFLELTRSFNCGINATSDPEFRAMWITTTSNRDWPHSAHDSSSKQQNDLIDYLNMAHDLNFNAVFLQVRPVGDAFYNSSIEPWSKYLTGTQGTPPSPFYDPLKFLCDQAHRRGIQVHAWLNPYMANTAPNRQGLAPNHMANRYPEYAYPYNGMLWMDPGAQVVLNHLLSVVKDIITRYDVDGIHFDDFFYPYPPEHPAVFPDNATYAKYLAQGGTMAKDDWRRDNVNRMVKSCWNLIGSSNAVTGKHVKLSISPFGLYRPGEPEGMPRPITGLDPYSEIYADSKLWVENGWINFLIPKLYWETHKPAQSYPTLLSWWCNVAAKSGVNIYAGNALYRLTEEGNWPVDELGLQVDISRASSLRNKLSLGNCQFSAIGLLNNVKGIRKIFAQLYNSPASIPKTPQKLKMKTEHNVGS